MNLRTLARIATLTVTSRGRAAERCSRPHRNRGGRFGPRLLTIGFVALASLASIALAQPTLDELARAQLPSWARPAVERSDFRERYLLDLSVNPFVHSADFDGDGFLDVALAVRDGASGARGVALLLQDESDPFVLGAGQADPAGDADFTWLVVWHVERRLPAGAALAPVGDTLVLAGLDGAHLWVFREAEGWRWTIP